MALREVVKQLTTKLERLGGVQGYVQRLMTTKDYRAGYFVGQDENGNKYYEDPGYIMGRNIFVLEKQPYMNEDVRGGEIVLGKMHTDKHGGIKPTLLMRSRGQRVVNNYKFMHRWIHYMGDVPPTEKPCPTPEWGMAPKAHATGTHGDYIPFRTTRPKVEAWDPTK